MTEGPPVPTRAASFLWFVAAAALAVAAVLRFRSGEPAWLSLGAAVLALAVGVRFLRRSRAGGG